MRTLRMFLSSATLFFVLGAQAQLLDTPSLINYQGFLTDPSGAPLDTVVSVTFKMYTASTGGAQLWTETQPSCTVRTGLFNVQLGSVTAVPDSFNQAQVWLGVTVGGNSEMVPRSRFVSVPYAYRVKSVDRAWGGTIVSPLKIESSADIGVGNYNNLMSSLVVGEQNSAFGGRSCILGGKFNRTWGAYSVVCGGGGDTPYDSNSANGNNSFIGGGSENWTNGTRSAVVGGLRNTASASYAFVGGGLWNEASGEKATVAGGAVNFALGEYSFVGGGRNNRAQGNYSTISGGGGPTQTDSNSATADWSFVGGGTRNRASGGYSAVSGGYGNSAESDVAFVGAGESNHAMSAYSAICGGKQNVAAHQYTSIGGGQNNAASDAWATIAGGQLNVASGVGSVVGGGIMNSAHSFGAVVGGGEFNHARGEYSTISGGGGAIADDSNSALGAYSTVGGGHRNWVAGQESVVSGGFQNYSTGSQSVISGGLNNFVGGTCAVVSGGNENSANSPYGSVGGGFDNHTVGYYSTVPGGLGNSAEGDFSFAAGRQAFAMGSGQFVWADGSGGTFITSPDSVNSFNARASGGYKFYTNGEATIGAKLLANATAWTAISDSTEKTDIRPVDTEALLAEIAQLPISEWRYKAQPDPSIRHIGPMAQDFWNAFHLGEDSLGISTIDPDGIALAAIQELAKRCGALENQNHVLQATNSVFENRIAQLENQLQQLTRQTYNDLKTTGK